MNLATIGKPNPALKVAPRGKLMRGMARNLSKSSWSIKGQEAITFRLLTAAVLGDDVALAQLRDLYTDCGEDSKAAEIGGVVEKNRKRVTHMMQWFPALYGTFLKDAARIGVVV